MPTIVDPDGLFDNAIDSAGANIFIDTALRTVKIRNNSAAPQGPVLDETGVTLQALYSFLKQEWKNDPNTKELIAYPFPLIAITPEQFEWRYGWTPADDSSRSLIRTAGWREFATDNLTQKREYIGAISLGNIDGDQNQDGAGDQDFAYYGFFDSADGTSTAGPFDFDFPGEVNQAIQTLDSTAFDRRGDILKLFIRQEAKTYDQTATTDIGLSAGTTLPFNTQRFPLVEGTDLQISGVTGLDDATITSNVGPNEKYNQVTGPRIEYLSTSAPSDTFGYSEDLLGGPYFFGITIRSQDGTDGTSPLANNEVYAWTQFSLRQDSDIEFASGTVKNGKLADELLEYVGSTLTTKRATNIDQSGLLTGTAITNIRATDINFTQLLPDSASLSLRSFPFSTGIVVNFSQDIRNDGDDASAFVYYDYTRSYTGTNFTIANVGTASGDANQDSANFILNGFTTTPLNTVQNPEGLNPAVPEDSFFRVSRTNTSVANHNVIWKVTTIFDSSNFAAITLDNDVSPVDSASVTGSIRNHPIDSPAAVLLDSAGAPSEQGGSAITTLLPANLNAEQQYTFSYAFDNNTQKDRVGGEPVAINIRAIGLENGTWVEQRGTITRVSENAFSVVSAVERNYNDPV